MGTDKAGLVHDGVPLGRRTALALRDAGLEVTVLGRTPIEGFPFQQDRVRFGGPLAALREFSSRRAHVFVASCDMPRFDAALVPVLLSRIGMHDAAIPSLDGRLQPLCALYTREAIVKLREPECAELLAVMAWVHGLRVLELDERTLQDAGLSPDLFRGANTPEEFERF